MVESKDIEDLIELFFRIEHKRATDPNGGTGENDGGDPAGAGGNEYGLGETAGEG